MRVSVKVGAQRAMKKRHHGLSEPSQKYCQKIRNVFQKAFMYSSVRGELLSGIDEVDCSFEKEYCVFTFCKENLNDYDASPG